jgi:hypothetical protein
LYNFAQKEGCGMESIVYNRTIPVRYTVDVFVGGGGPAGTAAAMTDDFTKLDVNELQKILVKNGVVLHEKDLI